MIRCCGTGFNRYIVECKCISVLGNMQFNNRFNRYIVECKYGTVSFEDVTEYGFNRYIVECKYRNNIIKWTVRF